MALDSWLGALDAWITRAPDYAYAEEEDAQPPRWCGVCHARDCDALEEHCTCCQHCGEPEHLGCEHRRPSGAPLGICDHRHHRGEPHVRRERCSFWRGVP